MVTFKLVRFVPTGTCTIKEVALKKTSDLGTVKPSIIKLDKEGGDFIFNTTF